MLVTVKEYASQCNVSETIIYRRIALGDIIPIIELVKSRPTDKGYKIKLIDTDKFPPSVERLRNGRKAYVSQ